MEFFDAWIYLERGRFLDVFKWLAWGFLFFVNIYFFYLGIFLFSILFVTVAFGLVFLGMKRHFFGLYLNNFKKRNKDLIASIDVSDDGYVKVVSEVHSTIAGAYDNFLFNKKDFMYKVFFVEELNSEIITLFNGQKNMSFEVSSLPEELFLKLKSIGVEKERFFVYGADQDRGRGRGER